MAAKMAKGGGLYLNNERITEPDREVTLADMLDESVAIMRVGKKQQYVIKVE
jgi:tyrosyl-tRNA synthetase